MPYLFDTDAISEVLKPRPQPEYLQWLANLPRREQYTSAIVIGELFAGAFLSEHTARHERNIRERLLGQITVLPFDEAVAETYGRIRATLQRAGRPLPDADLQIAATALSHGMALVTGNVKHFERVPRLQLCRVLADARAAALAAPKGRRR